MKPGKIEQIIKESLRILDIQISDQHPVVKQFLNDVSKLSQSGTVSKVFLRLDALDENDRGYICYTNNPITIELGLEKEDTDRSNEWETSMCSKFKNVRFVPRHLQDTKQIDLLASGSSSSQ